MTEPAAAPLYEVGELTEGQATKLMNSGDRVSFRLTRETVLREMKDALAADMKQYGWQWQDATAKKP